MSNVFIGLVVVAGIIILQSAISVHGQGQRCSRVGEMVIDRCGQRCLCSRSGIMIQCTRIRREFTSMSTADRVRYIETIKTASTSEIYKSRFEELITTHETYFNEFLNTDRHIHNKPQFLPWHRWYILQYENLMREVDPCFTVAYWDWAAVAGDAFDTTSPDSLWYNGDGGFGGNGRGRERCVDTGPFREGEWSLVGGGCLTREFNRVPPNWQELTALLNLPVQSFDDFEERLRNRLHDNVHCRIGGTMCTFDAAAAPEFFLHHGFIDKIWEDWQKKSIAHRRVYFSRPINRQLTGARPGVYAIHYLDNAALPLGIRVEYAEHGGRELRQTLRAMREMSMQQLRQMPIRVQPSPISQAAINLFHIARSVVRRLSQQVRRFQAVLSSPKGNEKPLTGIDKQLGFEHKKVIEMAQKAKSNPKPGQDEGESRPEETSDEKPAPLTGIDKGLGFEHKKVLEIARKAKSKPKPSQDEKSSSSEMVESGSSQG